MISGGGGGWNDIGRGRRVEGDAQNKMTLKNFGNIFSTKFNFKKLGLRYFQLRQVNITYKYKKYSIEIKC